jgi:hypothetical protein
MTIFAAAIWGVGARRDEAAASGQSAR